MSGSEMLPHRLGLMAQARRRKGDFLETLGRLVQEPQRALMDIFTKPDLSQAALVVLLALLGRSLAFFVTQGGVGDIRAFTQKTSAVFVSGVLLWLFMSWVWHITSRLAKKQGEYKAM